MTTHQVEELEHVLTDVIFINRGRVVLECSMEEASRLSQNRLSDSELNATESPKLFATEKKSRDMIALLLE